MLPYNDKFLIRHGNVGNEKPGKACMESDLIWLRKVKFEEENMKKALQNQTLCKISNENNHIACLVILERK